MNVTLKTFILKLVGILLTHSCFVHCGNPVRVRIGVISEATEDVRQNDPNFWSFSNDYSTAVSIEPLVTTVRWWDTLQVRRAACSLFGQGIDGLLSFPPPSVNPMLSSYATTYGLPLITARNPKVTPLNSEVQMIPNTEKTVSDLMGIYKWTSFAFMYDSDDGPILLQGILERNPQIAVESVWRVSNGEQAARFLQLLKTNADYQQKKEVQNVLFATDNAVLDEAISTMPMSFSGNMKFHFMSAHPVLRLQKKYFPVWHLVTRLCLVDSNTTVYKNVESRWQTLLQPYGRGSEPSTNEVPENGMLLHDAIRALSKSYNDFAQQNVAFGQQQDEGYALQTQCAQNPEKKHVMKSSKGVSASQHLKESVIQNGVTGTVKFEESGERIDFTLHVFETTTSVTRKVGEWSDYGGLKMIGDATSTKEVNDDPNRKDKGGQTGKPIIVTSILTQPYLMLKTSTKDQGNDRFYGFMKDLMDKLSSMLNTPYELRLVKDGRYGSYDGASWNGMIGEIVREEADVAVAPLTVSALREQVVDFTKPFVTLGMNILMKKPEVLDGKARTKLSPFGFLFAFTYETWLVLIAFYLFFGTGFFVVSLFTGAPDRIRSVETKGSDQLSACSSFWFAAGSLLLQNTGIYPRSVSHRVLSVVWWFFTLITVVAYISSLSSMLIKEKTKVHGSVDTYLTSFQLLKNFLETGSPSIGVLSSGTSQAFFMNSQIGVFHEYGKFLSENKGVMAKTYAEGIERVRNSNGSYVFIMESTSSEFVSSHPPCDTVTASGYLDTKVYGMAVKKGSYLRENLNQALLDMQETGELRQIYEKWWHQENECSNPTLDVLPGLYDNSLSVTEVSGVFYLLAIGVVVASVAAVIEYFVQSKILPVVK